MRHLSHILAVALLPLLPLPSARAQDLSSPDLPVGPVDASTSVVSTRQILHPAGLAVAWHGRPVDLALSPDAKTAYVKSNIALMVLDVPTWQIRQELRFPPKTGASMVGLAVAPDGHVWVTTGQSRLLEALPGPDGQLAWGRSIDLPSASGAKGERGVESYPCGLALSPDGKWALVAQSMGNALAEVNLDAGRQEETIPVGIAPWGVLLSPDAKRVYVSNWGGRRPGPADRTGESAGSRVLVDKHGVACTGTVSVIDAERGQVVAEIPVGLHPNSMALTRDGKRLFVANANSDSVSVIDTGAQKVVETIPVRPDDKLPWGSSPNSLCLSADEKTLYVPVGGNNAVAVVNLGNGAEAQSTLAGFIPAGWFPAAVATDGHDLFVANVKGIGSRDPVAKGQWTSHSYWGTVNKVAIPDASLLEKYTAQVREDALVPQILRAWEKGQSTVPPVPVPARVGEPSKIEHVVYVIKENRTYDQLFGDIKEGNGDPNLVNFGEDVTPNHHKLARDFALLDNFYCNGVLSADGHAWATEGYAVDYLERSFGAWTRSYPFPGDDALASAPTGFIWDNALSHGVTFRNLGEFEVTQCVPHMTAEQGYKDYLSGKKTCQFKNEIALASLRPYSNTDIAGWDLSIPDQQRADAFLRDFAKAEATGQWPNLTLLYLPNDHTSGTAPGNPTPRSMVADNDLALGRVVDAISHSKFWPTTAIFVVEDDPQNGVDHVDGHRSICLVISPYTRGRGTVSHFYNQTSVLHTMERILALPPMNQMDAMAPVMNAVFKDTPDPAPYACEKNRIPIDEMNPAKAALNGVQLQMAELSEKQNFAEPDRANEDDLNRVLWYATRGWDSRYPAEFAGPHGKGLAQLHLKLDRGAVDDDD